MTFIPKNTELSGTPCGVLCFYCHCGENNPLIKFGKELEDRSVDLDPDISEIVNQNFWELIGEEK